MTPLLPATLKREAGRVWNSERKACGRTLVIAFRIVTPFCCCFMIEKKVRSVMFVVTTIEKNATTKSDGHELPRARLRH